MLEIEKEMAKTALVKNRKIAETSTAVCKMQFYANNCLQNTARRQKKAKNNIIFTK
jgi:hypothetical protein